MNGEESWIPDIGSNDIKRFFQWILGCTYAKKSIRTRISEMFHFSEAPHIIVYERTEERPWWWTVAIITTVLIGVLSVYYTIESGIRAVRKFFINVMREPQSTVSTPRCLSPVKSTKVSPETPQTPTPVVRQKVLMNEPVNCVFIRPSNSKPSSDGSPKIPVPVLNSEEDGGDTDSSPPPPVINTKKEKKEAQPKRLEDAQFTPGSNLNIRPTMVPSPAVFANSTQPSRKSTGSDPPATRIDSSVSMQDQVDEWVMKQISGVKRLQEMDRSEAGRFEDSTEEAISPHVVSFDFMGRIQELIQENLRVSGALDTDSSDCNISEMSTVPPSTNPPTELSLEPNNLSVMFSGIGKETQGNEDQADIIIDDSSILAESENECSGSVLVANGPQKVLFRWTDDFPSTVDSVVLTGSFFGWKMNLPMRRRGEKMFEVCIELPDAIHDYSIRIYRFD